MEEKSIEDMRNEANGLQRRTDEGMEGDGSEEKRRKEKRRGDRRIL